jgi:selenide,water dikinase
MNPAIRTTTKRLIEYANCGGCAGKIAIDKVRRAVAGLPRFDDPNLLVGTDHFSDAGVYRIADNLAIVNTVDFFPPMVDDPYEFGRIAATNALSDVYAMGGVPKTGLNIVCFPDKDADPKLLHEILRGGAEQMHAAGAVIVGGHSLRDDEIKYGIAVTGVLDPRRMLTNERARPGDVLVLTKGLGTGLVAAAFRSKRCPADTLANAIASMTQLNRAASEAALAVQASAATDITGFGLAGHATEMAQASGVTLRIEVSRLPLIPGTESLAEAGNNTSRATDSNRAFASESMRVETDEHTLRFGYLFDAQTSGGLLISIAPGRADELIQRCHDGGATAACIIGSVCTFADNDCSLVIAD